jgi:adenylate cyclase
LREPTPASGSISGPFFKWAAPILLSVAVLLPPLAMIGAHHGAEEVIALAKDPQWRAEHIKPIPPPERAVIDEITLFYFPIGYAVALALVFVARGVRNLRERRRGMVTVSYPDKQVRIPKGLSVLEASLRFGVPHASVCGGRARAPHAASALSATTPACRARPAAKPSCLGASARATRRSVWRASCDRRPTSPSFQSCPHISARISSATAAASISARSARS